jgi:hypothetical protein
VGRGRYLNIMPLIKNKVLLNKCIQNLGMHLIILKLQL